MLGVAHAQGMNILLYVHLALNCFASFFEPEKRLQFSVTPSAELSISGLSNENFPPSRYAIAISKCHEVLKSLCFGQLDFVSGVRESLVPCQE